MADGDEIHANLPRRYLNNYKDICAPVFDAQDVAHDIARVVCKDIKDLGVPPLNFIRSCVEKVLNQLHEEPLLRQGIDYRSIQQQIDSVARQHFGNELGIDLAKRAVRSAIENYRQGGNSPTTESILKGYLLKIHEARFSERVPLTSAHLNGVSPGEIGNRLDAIRSFSEVEYSHLAKSLERNHGFDRRIQRRRYNQGLGLYDKVH